MKKIGIITTTRAEYGLLSPVIRELRKREGPDLCADLIVSGTHLSDAYGMTVKEIENAGVRIDFRVPILLNSDTGMDISENQADVLVKFTKLFQQKRYDAVILLGDRYETLAVAISAGNTNTPVFHLCGGDTTEGAMDEWIRHSITKMSYLHFTTNEESRKRVIQLGESPERVFNFGSTSIDNILTVADMERKEAMDSVGLSNERYALCTYHPVTLEEDSIREDMSAFLSAIRDFSEIEFIVTKSNADQGGARINRILEEAEPAIPNLHVFDSLGVRRYLSLMKYALFVLGNSSSGIIETPAFHIPTVNIGDRQRGRLQTKSVINCTPDSGSIKKAVGQALDPVFREACRMVISPYGDGNAAVRIAQKILEWLEKPIDLKKKFFDIEVMI